VLVSVNNDKNDAGVLLTVFAVWWGYSIACYFTVLNVGLVFCLVQLLLLVLTTVAGCSFSVLW
jgi:hypothetical protein